MNLSRPSSTITAATLTGMVIALIWEIVAMITTLEPSLGLVASSVAVGSGIVGYFKREKVLKLAPK